MLIKPALSFHSSSIHVVNKFIIDELAQNVNGLFLPQSIKPPAEK
jgi:hypothetical protein